LINVTGGPNMSLYEVNEAASLIQEDVHEDANIIFGAVIDEKVEDEIQVTVIATGFGERDADLRPTQWMTAHSPSATPSTAPVKAIPTRPIEPTQPRTSSSPPHPHPVQPAHANTFGGKPVRRLGMIVDDSTLDTPAFNRRTPDAGQTLLSNRDAIETSDELDIPVFLRKRRD
jgi:cell division protein FtsZ